MLEICNNFIICVWIIEVNLDKQIRNMWIPNRSVSCGVGVCLLMEYRMMKNCVAFVKIPLVKSEYTNLQ